MTDFPEPDSPTSARHSPGLTSNESPRTTRFQPPSSRKSTHRPETSMPGPVAVAGTVAGAVVLVASATGALTVIALPFLRGPA